jgi:integrase
MNQSPIVPIGYRRQGGRLVRRGKDGLCTLHDLRRAFGSRWAAKVPAQVLQRMMRHADIKTTLEFYADVEESAIDAVWGKQPAKAATPERATA